MDTINKASIPILMVDDDKDDCVIAQKALEKANIQNPIHFVHDGEQLLDYLSDNSNPTPGFILLDLNMPRMDGKSAIREIKSNENLKTIPVVFFTTSKAQEDIHECYELGANSYVTKPVNFTEMVKTITDVMNYWLHSAHLPGR